jgi:PAS domain S-box-containing protein
VQDSQLPEVILDRMADGVMLFDVEDRVVYASAQAERMSGYSREELAGRTVETLVPASLRATHEAHRERYVRAPVTRSMGTRPDISLRRKDGRELPVDIALSPLQAWTASASSLSSATPRNGGWSSARCASRRSSWSSPTTASWFGGPEAAS